MIKVRRKYFLTLCMLLLSGYSLMYAESHRSGICDSLEKAFAESVHNNACLAITTSTPGGRYVVSVSQESTKIYFEEKEEEGYELAFLKVYGAVGNYCSSLYTSASRYSFYSIRQGFAFMKHWFYASCRRHIVLRVIRI